MVGSIGVMEAGNGVNGDSSGKSSGIGSEEAPSPSPDHVPPFLTSHDLNDDHSSSGTILPANSDTYNF